MLCLRSEILCLLVTFTLVSIQGWLVEVGSVKVQRCCHYTTLHRASLTDWLLDLILSKLESGSDANHHKHHLKRPVSESSYFRAGISSRSLVYHLFLPVCSPGSHLWEDLSHSHELAERSSPRSENLFVCV